jgi:hypothetical protein
MFCQNCNFDLRNLPRRKCPECGRAFFPSDPTTFLAHPRSAFARLLPHILLTLGILFILALATGGYLVYRGIQITMRAEERLQATRVVAELIADHIEKSPTHSWPTSWADLEKLPREGCMFRWPQQASEYKAIVTIDFTTTTAKVLTQSRHLHRRHRPPRPKLRRLPATGTSAPLLTPPPTRRPRPDPRPRSAPERPRLTSCTLPKMINDLHVSGEDAAKFYTKSKVVVARRM